MPQNSMENYRLRMAGFGLKDEDIDNIPYNCGLSVYRKGEIKNESSAVKYKENTIILEEITTYEIGYEEAINRIIKKFKTYPELTALFQKCNYRELQVWATLDDENRVPSIHLTPDQIVFLSKMKAHVDVDII